MKKIFCILIVFSIIAGVVPLSFAAALQWAEVSSVSFEEELPAVEATGRSSKLQYDNALTYEGVQTLKNSSDEFLPEDGVIFGEALPKMDETKIGKSFKISMKLYSGILVNGRYSGKSKLRIGITDGKGKTFASVKELDVREWTDVEFVYTVNEENMDCDKIFIDRGGKDNKIDFPRWFSAASVKVFMACTPEEAAEILNKEQLWTQFSYDGFENTIENIGTIKESITMYPTHQGNATERIKGVEPYEGYSCIQNFTGSDITPGGFIFNNLLPHFTKADIGRKIKVSVQYYIQQLKSGTYQNVGMQLGICDESETQRDTKKGFAAYGKWVKLENEIEITEKNLNYNKIILAYDNGWNFPMWSRVDAVSVMVSADESGSDNEAVHLNIDGKEVKLNTQPLIVDDRVMLPAKETFDALGAGNVLSEDKKSITATFGRQTSTFTSGSDTVDVSGRKIFECGGKSEIIDSVLYVPATAIKVAFDADMTWDALTAELSISTEFPIIRRNVPTSTLTDNKDLYDIHYDEHEWKEVYAWDNLPEYETVLSDNDLLKKGKLVGQGTYGTSKIVDVEGMPFSQALEVTCTNLPSSDTYFQLELPEFDGKYEFGDTMMVELTFRGFDVTHEDHQGVLRVVVEKNYGAYYKAINETVYAGEDWFTVHIPYIPTDHEFFRATVVFGGRLQRVQVGGYKVVKFKEPLALEQFDLGTVRKEAMEEVYSKDVQWRNEAIARIEQIRKGDINVVVVDKNGNPVPDAEVDVSMFEHEFEWGSCINTNMLAAETEDENHWYFSDENFVAESERYSMYFNSGVAESATKWAGYQVNRFVTRQLMNLLEKKGVYHMRGHSAMWEGDHVLPQNALVMLDDYEALNKLIYDHYDALYTDYGDIDDWDIMNETVWSNDISSRYGEQVFNEWYDYAVQNLPEGSDLGYNETQYGALWTNLIDRMLDAGVKVNSFGIQSHYTFGVTEERLANFEELEKRGLKGRVTEFDLREDDPELQAGNVRDYLIAAFASPAIEGFYMWGYWDSSHWAKNAPILYADGTLKPAGEQYVDLVYNKWWTQEKGTTDSNGVYKTRGFYGDYDITVTKGGATISKVVSVSKDNPDNTIIVTFY